MRLATSAPVTPWLDMVLLYLLKVCLQFALMIKLATIMMIERMNPP
jgi:hypothetical protein